MHPVSVIPQQRGFGLIEAIVAASLVAGALLGLVSVVVATQEGEAVVAARAQREAALQNERARLVALPYWQTPSSVAAEGETGQQLACVLAEVFPHAAAGPASSAAMYLVSEGVGVFVSERRIGSVVVRREARFVRGAAGGRIQVASADLEGWNVATSQEPPAARVLVTLTATTGSAFSSLTASFGATSLAVSGEAS